MARERGLCAAGQDLLVDAPSGNIRGAGPAVAEIELERDPASADRPAKAFLVFAGDKCSPGAYNFPLCAVFSDPMHNGGLLLSPKLHKGFTLTIIDMDHRADGGDSVIRLDVPERGKGDPVAIVRTQGIFPAPEEVIEPYTLGHFVSGDARGSHVMPLMPVAIDTAVAGPYCLPLVSCVAFSMNAGGRFTDETVDVFGNVAWDATRTKVQAEADEWRRQGFVGPPMASHAELAYTGIVDALTALEREFTIRREDAQVLATAAKS